MAANQRVFPTLGAHTATPASQTYPNPSESAQTALTVESTDLESLKLVTSKLDQIRRCNTQESTLYPSIDYIQPCKPVHSPFVDYSNFGKVQGVGIPKSANSSQQTLRLTNFDDLMNLNLQNLSISEDDVYYGNQMEKYIAQQEDIDQQAQQNVKPENFTEQTQQQFQNSNQTLNYAHNQRQQLYRKQQLQNPNLDQQPNFQQGQQFQNYFQVDQKESLDNAQYSQQQFQQTTKNRIQNYTQEQSYQTGYQKQLHTNQQITSNNQQENQDGEQFQYTRQQGWEDDQGYPPTPPPPPPQQFSNFLPQNISQTDKLQHRQIHISRQNMVVRFLAYDGCLQVCHEAQMKEKDPSAEVFLDENCRQLREAFCLNQLLLNPADNQTGIFDHPKSILWEEGKNLENKRGGFVRIKRTLKIKCCRLLMNTSAQQLLNYKYQRYFCTNSTNNCCGPDMDAFVVCLRPVEFENDEIVANARILGDGEVADSSILMVSSEQQSGQIKVEIKDVSGKIVARGSTNFQECWKQALEIQGFVNSKTSFRKASLRSYKSKKKKYSWLRFLVPTKSKKSNKFQPSAKFNRSIQNQQAKIKVNCYATGQNIFSTVILEVWVEDSDEMNIVQKNSEQKGEIVHSSQIFAEMSTMHQTTQISNYQIYEFILDCALKNCSCGPRSLVMSPGWCWLLNRFAYKFGVRDAYTILMFLKWVVKPESCTCTSDCLFVLFQRIQLLLQYKEAGLLINFEDVIFEDVLKQTEQILGKTFENYKGLSDDAARGVLEGGGFSQEFPPVVLQPAVDLFNLLKDPLNPTDQFWLEEKIISAAKSTYQKLSCNCGEISQKQIKSEQNYLNVANLIRDIRNEIERDNELENLGMLPQFLELTKITSQMYISNLNYKLINIFNVQPPSFPTQSSVEMIIEMGKLERYLQEKQLTKNPDDNHGAEFVALSLFSPHFDTWLERLERDLINKARELEATMKAVTRNAHQGDGSEHKFTAPVIIEIMQQLQEETQKLEQIITFWPQLAPALEQSVCTVMREAVLIISRQCGMKRIREIDENETFTSNNNNSFNNISNNLLKNQKTNNNKSSSSNILYNSSASRLPVGGPKSPFWEWHPLFQNSCTASPYSIWVVEAILLNSLRRLLELLPILEETLRNWCGTQHLPAPLYPAPPGGRSMSPIRAHVLGLQFEKGIQGPHLGVHFAQLVMEIRSEYAYAVIESSRRLSRMISTTSTTSISVITAQQKDLVYNMAPLLSPFVDIVQQMLGVMKGCLEDRVFIAMARGVWDFCAKELLQYVDVLHQCKENQGVWRWRQNAEKALQVVDSFFRSCITEYQMGNLVDRDLDYPLHSQELHNLLQSPMNVSYHVL